MPWVTQGRTLGGTLGKGLAPVSLCPERGRCGESLALCLQTLFSFIFFISFFFFSIYILREAGQLWRSEDDLHQSGLPYHMDWMQVSRLGHKGLYHISQIADLSVYKLLKGPHFRVSWPPPSCQLQDKRACTGSSLLEALAPASLHAAPPTPAL